MLVNQNAPLVGLLAFDLLQDALPLQHDREDIAGIRVILIIFREQASQEILGVFLRKRIGWGIGGRFVARFPKGKRSNVLIPFRPRFLA